MPFFSAEPGIYPISFFSLWHIAALAVLAVALALSLLGRKFLRRFFDKQSRRVVLSLLIALADFYFRWWNLRVKGEDWVTGALPLELCHIDLYLSMVVFVFGSRKGFKVLYFLSLGALAALIYPNVDGLGPDRFRYYHYFVVHFLPIWVGAYSVASLGYRIQLRDFFAGVAWLIAVGFAALVVNLAGGYNFMFLMELPLDLPELAQFFHSWKYTIALVMTAVLAMYLAYVPWIFVNASQRRENHGTGR